VLTYLDASVIASLLFAEPTSSRVIMAIRSFGSGMLVSDFAAAEVASGVSKRLRMGLDTEKTATTRLAAFDVFRSELTETAALDAEDIRSAEQLVRTFELKLRTPDAIHAAVCLRHNYQLATLDTNLANAARALGVACINPADQIGEQKN
jgi:predicted nucleic acid-binding protein